LQAGDPPGRGQRPRQPRKAGLVPDDARKGYNGYSQPGPFGRPDSEVPDPEVGSDFVCNNSEGTVSTNDYRKLSKVNKRLDKSRRSLVYIIRLVDIFLYKKPVTGRR
jgi:hypothetical protein